MWVKPSHKSVAQYSWSFVFMCVCVCVCVCSLQFTPAILDTTNSLFYSQAAQQLNRGEKNPCNYVRKNTGLKLIVYLKVVPKNGQPNWSVGTSLNSTWLVCSIAKSSSCYNVWVAVKCFLSVQYLWCKHPLHSLLPAFRKMIKCF